MQIPSDQATSPEECEYLGDGGANIVPCDYVTVMFSESVPTQDLAIDVDTADGDHFDISSDPDAGEVSMRVELDAPANTHANGFALSKAIQQPHFSPAYLDVVVRLGQTTIADTRVTPMYSCVEETRFDWCWKGAPVTITVTP